MGRKKNRKSRKSSGPESRATTQTVPEVVEDVGDLEFVDDLPQGKSHEPERVVAPVVAPPAKVLLEESDESNEVAIFEKPQPKKSQPQNPVSGPKSEREASDSEPDRSSTPEPTSPSSSKPGLPEEPVSVAGPSLTSSTSPPPDEPSAETLGELLQHAREVRSISLEEASARTRINAKHLRHLENDRFSEFAAEAYIKGFLRSYGTFLGLDIGMLIRRYDSLAGNQPDPQPEIWDITEIEPHRRAGWRPQRRTVSIVTFVIVAALLGWVFWSQGATKLGLRPTDSLEQIEKELQGTHKPRVETPSEPLGSEATSNSKAAPEDGASPVPAKRPAVSASKNKKKTTGGAASPAKTSAPTESPKPKRSSRSQSVANDKPKSNSKPAAGADVKAKTPVKRPATVDSAAKRPRVPTTVKKIVAKKKKPVPRRPVRRKAPTSPEDAAGPPR